MKTKIALSKEKQNNASTAYITKRVVVNSSRAAIRKAAAIAIETVGYAIIAKDGWIVRENKDGTIVKLSKYKPAHALPLALD